MVLAETWQNSWPHPGSSLRRAARQRDRVHFYSSTSPDRWHGAWPWIPVPERRPNGVTVPFGLAKPDVLRANKGTIRRDVLVRYLPYARRAYLRYIIGLGVVYSYLVRAPV